jgi:peptide/nickel transport system permease protein
MIGYIIRRLLQSIVVLFLISIIVFTVMRVLPGDPLLIYIQQQDINMLTPEREALLRHEFGLDKPAVVQYVEWVSNLFHGNFGASIFYGTSVRNLLAQRLPVTFHLGILSLILIIILGIPLGLLSALRRGKLLDNVIAIISNLGIATPNFWMGILLIYGVGLYLGWLPIQGYTSPFKDFWLSTRQLVMPVLVLSTFGIASTIRQTRSSMLEVIRQDYIRTAWSKGLRERAVVTKHVLKNGLIPVVTLIGTHVSVIIGGSVLIESVFNIPGMGRLMTQAVFERDYQVTQAGILVLGTAVVLVNLIVDISYGWLDPRIRYGD